MIKLKVSDVKEFFKRSRSIKPSVSLPVTDYIKLDCVGDKAVATKTNVNTYCIHEMDAEFEKNAVLFVDEYKFSTFVNKTSAEAITIKKAGRGLLISDGTTDLTISTSNGEGFPVPPCEGQHSVVDIPTAVVESIYIAKSYLHSSKDHPLAHCYIVPTEKGTDIFATDGSVFYLQGFEEQLPALVLGPETCSLLAGYANLQHFSAGNYDFFIVGATTFGFVKPVFKTPPYKAIVERFSQDGAFLMNKKDLVHFCDLATSASASDIAFAVLADKDEQHVQATCAHKESQMKLHMDIAVEGKTTPPPPFSFSTKFVGQALRALPFEKIGLCAIQDKKGKAYCLYTPEDARYMGLFSGFSND